MNAHYLFHVKYFEGLAAGESRTEEHVLKLNRELINMMYKKSGQIIPTEGFDHFTMSVLYPGLLLGLGNPHALADGTGNTAEDIKSGFFMDYVTGLPVIPGTMVKGTIRSVFKKPVKTELKDKRTAAYWTGRQEAYEERKQFISEMLAAVVMEKSGRSLTFDPVSDFENLEDELFVSGSDRGGGRICAGKDIFLDAWPVGTAADRIHDRNGYGIREEENPRKLKRKIYGLDFITPHKMAKKDKAFWYGKHWEKWENREQAYEELDAVANPNPIRILKVLPGVRYLFRFQLVPSARYPQITAEVKRELYRRILEVFGIGAKTDIGFGLLEPCRCDEKEAYYMLMPSSTKKG